MLASARAVDVGQLAREMLPAIAEEFSACVVGCYIDRGSGILEGHPVPDMPELVSEYSRTYAAADPLHAAKSAAIAAGQFVVVPTQMIERKTFRASQVYADYYRPWKIEHVAVIQTRDRGGSDGIGVAIGRSGRQGDFSAADVRMLRRLWPTLRAVSERLLDADRVHRRAGALALLADALEEDRSTLLLGSDGQLLWCSTGARRDVDPAACAEALAQTARALCRGSRGATTSLELDCRGRRVSVALSILGDADARGPFVLVRLKDLKASDALERWARAVGLTKGEERVLRALCEGGTNAEIGRRLYVSSGTIRTHVEHIFRKLGVSSRLQAVLEAQRGAKLGGGVP